MLIKSALRYSNGKLVILDQTRLPGKIQYIRLKNYEEVITALQELKIRGAPLIGIAAAYGLALESTRQKSNLRPYLRKIARELSKARPTAVNLGWAIYRMTAVINDKNISDFALSQKLIEEAQRIEKTEKDNSCTIGQIGSQLIKNNSTIITICNTGWLATPGVGTALGIIYTAHKQGKKINVLALETRPLLQGARLTAFELKQAKIPYTLITDNMMASVMHKVDLVLTGADRIVRNGDTANKIGTLTLAITAKYYKVPFYVVAPISTFDLSKENGQEIAIEQRDKSEILYLNNKEIAPKNSRVYNPAFDITPNRLITAIITEKGIVRPPFNKSIKKL